VAPKARGARKIHSAYAGLTAVGTPFSFFRSADVSPAFSIPRMPGRDAPATEDEDGSRPGYGV